MRNAAKNKKHKIAVGVVHAGAIMLTIVSLIDSYNRGVRQFFASIIRPLSQRIFRIAPAIHSVSKGLRALVLIYLQTPGYVK